MSDEKIQEALKVLKNVDHYLMREEYWSDDYNLRQADRLEKLGAPQRVVNNLRNPKTPVETVASFLSGIEYLDWEELEGEFKKRVSYAPRGLIVNLRALEQIISTPQEKDVLAYLVAVDANRNIPDPSDDGAREWLREISEIVRKALGDLAPPKLEEAN